MSHEKNLKILEKNNQNLDDFKVFGTALKGIIFMIDEFYLGEYELDQIQNYINNKRSELYITNTLKPKK